MRTIDLVRKRDRIYAITVVDSLGAPVVLTGATVKLSVRSEENATTVIKTYSTAPIAGEGTITVTNAAGGVIEIQFDDTHFAAQAIPLGKKSIEWRWDLLVITALGTRLDTRDGTDYVQKFVLHTNITD